MRLQAKFTLVLTLSVFIPAFFAGLFLSGQIYGMVISDSIRKEQETASKTLPKIEEVLSQVHNAVTELTGRPASVLSSTCRKKSSCRKRRA